MRRGRPRVELARSERLGERLLERPPDRHRLPHRLHVGGEPRLGSRELLEREARPLDHAVVDRGLEAGRGGSRDVVGNLLQRVADRQPGGDLGDRESRRLAGQRARARYPRVHLDHHDLVGGAVDRELDVRPAGLHADGADGCDRLVAQRLVLLVGERLLRRDADAVAGVHAHRIEVLDRADDHDVVGPVAHHLELELAPTQHRLLEQDLGDRRGLEPTADHACEVVLGVHDAAALPAEREGGPDDERETDLGDRGKGIVDRVSDRAARHAQPGLGHRLAEALAILGALDRVDVRADQLDPVALERAVLVQGLGQVERGLAAEGGQQGVWALPFDHLAHRPGEQRLDVGRGGHLRIGHDRGRIGVDQHHLVAFVHQHPAGLGARVVEFGRLANHDRARADQEDLVQVVAAGHGGYPASRISFDEPVEQMESVVGPGSRLGVVLHGGALHVFQGEPLDGAVVQIDVGQLGGAEVGLPAHGLVFVDRPGAVRAEDRKAVVLAGDLDDAGGQVLHRVVGAMVAERQLVGGEPDRLAEQLVAEADPVHRALADERADRLHDVAEGGRVTRAVGQEDRVGVVGQKVGGGRRGRVQFDRGAALEQVAHDRAP